MQLFYIAHVPNSRFHTAISYPRYSRYLVACGNNKRAALKLYRANMKLSAALYTVIGIFEIILRNSIDRHMTKALGKEWLADAIKPGGYLETRGCERSYRDVKKKVRSLGDAYTHDKLVSELTFSFWVYQFANKQFAACGSTLLDIFHNRPFGIFQKDIFQFLVKIKDLRNRIAHYEPICFHNQTISITETYKRYQTLLQLLSWLGCHPRKILFVLDRVPHRIQTISTLHPKNFPKTQLQTRTFPH